MRAMRWPSARVLGRCFVAASVHISFSSAGCQGPACPRTILVNGRDSGCSLAWRRRDSPETRKSPQSQETLAVVVARRSVSAVPRDKFVDISAYRSLPSDQSVSVYYSIRSSKHSVIQFVFVLPSVLDVYIHFCGVHGHTRPADRGAVVLLLHAAPEVDGRSAQALRSTSLSLSPSPPPSARAHVGPGFRPVPRYPCRRSPRHRHRGACGSTPACP